MRAIEMGSSAFGGSVPEVQRRPKEREFDPTVTGRIVDRFRLFQHAIVDNKAIVSDCEEVPLRHSDGSPFGFKRTVSAEINGDKIMISLSQGLLSNGDDTVHPFRRVHVHRAPINSDTDECTVISVMDGHVPHVHYHFQMEDAQNIPFINTRYAVTRVDAFANRLASKIQHPKQ